MKTTIQETDVLMESDVCCPEFDPTLLDNKKHEWTDKLFLKDSIPEFFHVPLPKTFGKAVTRMWKKVNDADAAPDAKDFLLLAYDPTPFKSELLMSITKEIPGEEVAKLSGTYYSKVFDGPYNQVPKYMKEMNKYLASMQLKAKKYFFHYAYCPDCAKKYGHNYVMALAEVKC